MCCCAVAVRCAKSFQYDKQEFAFKHKFQTILLSPGSVRLSALNFWGAVSTQCFS